MKEEHAALRESESGLRSKWSRLEEMSGQQGAELKQLREQVAVLEGENKDSDMKMELATQRKDREIKVIFISFFQDFFLRFCTYFFYLWNWDSMHAVSVELFILNLLKLKQTFGGGNDDET